MKQIRHNGWEKLTFLDFDVKPRPLITMHDIGGKSNRAQLHTMTDISVKYDAQQAFS